MLWLHFLFTFWSRKIGQHFWTDQVKCISGGSWSKFILSHTKLYPGEFCNVVKCFKLLPLLYYPFPSVKASYSKCHIYRETKKTHLGLCDLFIQPQYIVPIYERLPQWLWLERSSQHMQIVITGAMLQLGQSPGITAGAVAPVITCYAPVITCYAPAITWIQL